MSLEKQGRAYSLQNLRKWDRVIAPIMRYNRHSSQLGYPLDFVFELEKHVADGHSLRLNIPTTMSGTKDNCIRTVFADEAEEVGRIIFAGNMIKSIFDSEIEKKMQEIIAKLCEKDHAFGAFIGELRLNNLLDQAMPCVLIKEKCIDEQTRVSLRTELLSKDEYKKIPNIEVNQITQSFLFGNSKTASLTRFFYLPAKNSLAYKIDNLEVYVKKKPSKQVWRVCENSEQSFTFVKIMFSNKSFYHQTQTLVKFLESTMKIKVIKIVTDWILDVSNRYFLVDVREAQIERQAELAKIDNQISDCISFLSCSVCQRKFPFEQMNKILTCRMIWEFFEHLKKRQISLSFLPAYRYSSNTVKVCDLCYELVVSEIRLMDLEQTIARVTHTSCNNWSGSLIEGFRNTYLSEMYEWRLFLYLEDIRDLDLEQVDDKPSYFAMLRIHNSITTFRLKDLHNKQCMVKGIRIHYIFSETDKIDKFLTKTEVTIRITNQKNWNAVVAEGNTGGLYEESEKHSMRKFKQILVFDSKSKYSVVGLHIGIKLEGKYRSDKLSLTKHLDAFMVNSDYSNSYALPAEWMETVDPSYCAENEQEGNKLDPYLPKISKRNKMSSVATKPKLKLIL